MKSDQVGVGVLHRVQRDPHSRIEDVSPQRVEIRLGRVNLNRLLDFLEQVKRVEGKREYVVQMRVGDYDRTNPKLLLPTQADGDRPGVNRQRIVDQIGGQQLNSPIRRAWDDSEFHFDFLRDFSIAWNSPCAAATVFAGPVNLKKTSPPGPSAIAPSSR